MENQSAQEEKWADIEGYEGTYQVSDLGRVRSLTRTRATANRYGSVTMRTDHGKIINATDNGNGYMIVGLRLSGKPRKNYYVHRLVAQHFVPNPKGEKVINHIDHDRKNNRAENLEWCTQKDNVKHSAHLMRHEKEKFKASNTGEKYICKKRYGYQVGIDRLRIWRTFDTFDEAINFRNEVIRNA